MNAWKQTSVTGGGIHYQPSVCDVCIHFMSILVLVCVQMNVCIRAYHSLCGEWMDCGTGNLPWVCAYCNKQNTQL